MAKTAFFYEHEELESINIYSLNVMIALNHSSLFGERKIKLN